MSIHDGHRLRMYEKLKNTKLAEHEILEILLYNGMPRKNTNELAHTLILKFGSLDGVYSACMEDLQKVDGVGVQLAGYIFLFGELVRRATQIETERERFKERFSTTAFTPFVKKTYKNVLVEVVDLYLLDGDGYVIKKQRFSTDSICKVQVVPEEFSSFLLTQGASGIVMVHNHPVGEAQPSKADDQMTKNCQILCSAHNLLLCDHIIYAPNGVYSYYLDGRLQEISKNYSVQSVLGLGRDDEE